MEHGTIELAKVPRLSRKFQDSILEITNFSAAGMEADCADCVIFDTDSLLFRDNSFKRRSKLDELAAPTCIKTIAFIRYRDSTLTSE